MKAPLVFIPGLGADSRLFRPQQKYFKNSLAPSWFAPRKKESLHHYACRWVKFLRLKPGCVLVGVSFGGMVALEMAKSVKPKSVILIGSCRSPSSIPFLFRMLLSVPGLFRICKKMAEIFPFLSGWLIGAGVLEERDFLIRMFLGMPNSFLNWTTWALRSWKGVDKGNGRIYHIHGEKDHLIPCKNVKPNKVVRGGGHVISLTHSKEVNEFILKCIR